MCSLAAVGGDAEAETFDDETSAPRWSASLEFAGLFSRAQGERRDTSGWAAIVPRYRWAVQRDVTLTVGIGIPVLPIIAFHAPIGAEWSPRGPRRGPVLRAHVRPLWSLVDLCGGSGDCPMNDAADPYDRGASMFGGAFDVGAGYRFGGDAWSFEVAAAYAIGGFVGHTGMTETPIDGVYQGFTLGFGLVH